MAISPKSARPGAHLRIADSPSYRDYYCDFSNTARRTLFCVLPIALPIGSTMVNSPIAEKPGASFCTADSPPYREYYGDFSNTARPDAFLRIADSHPDREYYGDFSNSRYTGL